MAIQQKTAVSVLDNVRSLLTSEAYQRGPIYPVKVLARLVGARSGQSSTIIINGGDTASPSIPLATITLTEAEPEESFTVYAPYAYLNAVVSAFDISKPGNVTVVFNALED